MYRNASIRTEGRAQYTLLALTLIPYGRLGTPLTGLGKPARTGLVYLTPDGHILPRDILIDILCFYHISSFHGP